MYNTCFSKSLFDTLKEQEKIEYMKNNMFFCYNCKNIYNVCLIKTNDLYNKNKTYYSLMDCKYHYYRSYPIWYQ